MPQLRVIFVGACAPLLEWLCRHPEAVLLRAYLPPRAPQLGVLLSLCAHYEIPAQLAADGEALRETLPPALDLGFCAFFERLPEEVFTTPRLGFLNFHPAPLPARPGRHPLPGLIMSEATEGRATWHWVEAGLDQGAIFEEAPVARLALDDPSRLEARTIEVGLRLLAEGWPSLLGGYAARVPQPLDVPRHPSQRARVPLSDMLAPIDALRILLAQAPYGGTPMALESSAAQGQETGADADRSERLIFLGRATLCVLSKEVSAGEILPSVPAASPLPLNAPLSTPTFRLSLGGGWGLEVERWDPTDWSPRAGERLITPAGDPRERWPLP
ncbi:MAG: formyltransferase family protein [Myxococcota bacterium]|nr:formyltransferase family protein [Myxococcota bacterium]